ncbi:hypothetical protein H9Q09_12295 [Aurantimonas sp. DM33-3]|uniref:hypothetical protein n=1 Tax=Aurantimonas sp. DM33-3 TaxID=2766955 RepID=UPI0016526714|nr:hypothetical protein [Aurantimonas sp. DM33-3]MBC6716988.1 hypothetical protein [Aurantimonas sp. DM33-3]
MIDLELPASLPDDKHIAFLRFERHKSEILEKDASHRNHTAEHEYIAAINAFAEHYGFAELEAATENYLNTIGDQENFDHFAYCRGIILRAKNASAFKAAA